MALPNTSSRATEPAGTGYIETAGDDKRFYRDGRKVMDREKSSHGIVYCEARSNHAAEVIQHALNSWHGMGPARTLPKWIKKRIAKRKSRKSQKLKAGQYVE